MIVSSASVIPGYRVTPVVETAPAVARATSEMPAPRPSAGGESNMVSAGGASRVDALASLTLAAQLLGANAIVGVSCQLVSQAGAEEQYLAFGSAVVVEPV